MEHRFVCTRQARIPRAGEKHEFYDFQSKRHDFTIIQVCTVDIHDTTLSF